MCRTYACVLTIDFAALFARSPNPYVVLDRDLVIAWANEAYCAVTMRGRDDILGRKLTDAFPSDPSSESYNLLTRSLQQVLETGQADEIAIIRYDIPRPDGQMDVRYWSATHTPLPDMAGAPSYILQHTVDITELHNLRRARDEAGLIRRASAVQERNLDLAAESRRLLDFFSHAPGFVAMLEGPDHRFIMANRAYRDLVGRDDLIGRTVYEALPEVIDQGYGEILDQVRASRQPFYGRRTRVLLNRVPQDGPAERSLNFIFQPVFTDDGPVTGIIIQGYDVTEEVEYEERQNLLIGELSHRVKNTLAIVQGLAGQSFRGIAGADAAQAIFSARLKALAAAHSLLTEGQWGDASLAECVRRSAEATTGDAVTRLSLGGPDVTLPPQTAVSLAMIVHELCTNALKYGALANDEGQIAITWSVSPSPEPELQLVWRESGGPLVQPPTRRGFGTRLIERGLPADGKVVMNYEPDGFACTIKARLPGEGRAEITA